MNRKQLPYTILAFFIFLAAFWGKQAATAVQLPKDEGVVLFYSTEGGDDLTHTIASAIIAAEKEVMLVVYTLNDKTIIGALREKASEGVAVTVICDGEANPGIEKRLGSKIRTLPLFEKGLMHQKILIVDGGSVWIGSANMTGYSLRVHGNLVLGVYSPSLAAYLLDYIGNTFLKASHEPGRHATFAMQGQQLEMWLLPHAEGAIPRLLDLIKSAKKTIRVAMFTWTRRDLAQAMVEARLRGVKVETALDNNSSKGASAKIAALLLRKGIPVTVNTGPGLLHYKMMIVDNETLVNGSANWTMAAFTKNRDCFLILSPLTAAQQEALNTLWTTLTTHGQPL